MAKGTDGLTLAGRPAAFRALSALATIGLADEADQAATALLARYPALAGLTGDAFRSHPERLRYLLEYDLYAVRIPALRAAWAGEGEAPAGEAIAAGSQADLLACCREVRRLNPFLVDLPGEEEARPNP